MEYYTKAIEILDKQIKEGKIEHLIGKHSKIYETSLKAIMEALILTDVGNPLKDKQATTYDDWLDDNCEVDSNDFNRFKYKGSWHWKYDLIEEYKNN